jgi:shikimate kinase/3-dehydroquinate synthase
MAEVGTSPGPAAAGRVPAAAGARKLVIVGFMCAGKSRLGRLAAQRLGWPLVDSDQLLEERVGEQIASFFDREGEEAFRDREQELVLELLAAPGPAIVPLGGGALERKPVRDALAGHDVVYVEVDLDVAWDRAQSSARIRPLARDRERFARLHAARRPLYESVAGVVLADGAEKTPAFVDALVRPGRGEHRMIWAAQDYPVWVGAGVLDVAGDFLSDRGRCFVVADEHVLELHGERLAGLADTTLTVPSGERHKTMAQAERLLRELAAAGMQRSDTIVALGGGVVGDLAGFCAATYQRGVAIAHVPTTVVAQVDSAYGGKTGVDLPEAKNYVGAFHQPAAVLTDPTVLGTLPPQELAAGFAEVVKTALIAGGGLWEEVRGLPPLRDLVESDLVTLTRVIEACARTKLSVVAIDERDTGFRAALNLGHTFAHALESATGYGRWRHGEAVGLGLLVALRVSERVTGLDRALRDDVARLLERHGVPGTFEGPQVAELLDHMARDKKRRGAHRNLVLLRSPGDVAVESEADEAALVEAIEELRAR